MSCVKNRIDGDGVDKCKDISQYTVKLKVDKGTLMYEKTCNGSYCGMKINSRAITAITENFAATLTEEEICGYLKSFDNIRKNTNYNWPTKFSETAQDAVRKAENSLCKYLVPATCEQRLNPEHPSHDPDLLDEFNACAADDTKRWSNCKCKKISTPNNDEVVNEPEKVYGCLDPTASDYYCLTNDCVDNKPPSNVEGIGCEFQKTYEIVNNYVFCNTHEGCLNDTENKVTSTLNTATIEDNGTLQGQEDGALGYINDVYEAQKVIVKKANKLKKFMYLQNDGEPQGFYVTSTWDETLVNEFAAALTIEIFRTKLAGSETFPFQRVTIFSPDSRLLGHFSIETNTDENGYTDSIEKLSGKESSRLLNYRLKFHIGTQIMNLTLVDVYRQALDSGSGTFDSTYSLDNEGRVIQDPVTEGLISVLKKEPIGLAKLLK